MKLIYIIETVQEYLTVASPVRQQDDARPMLTGHLEVTQAESLDGTHRVQLVEDSHYQFSMPFRDFVVACAEQLGVKLMGQGAIPL